MPPTVRKVLSLTPALAVAAPKVAAAISGLGNATLHPDGVRRCWGEYYSKAPDQMLYHDKEWGRALPLGSGRLLFKQLVLQTFQAGLTWAIIHKKAPFFERRFCGWDYTTVARWRESDIEAALADAGIVRNLAKIRAAVTNAAVATKLDSSAPDGFEAFCWRVCGSLPHAERLLQTSSRSGTHMRATTKEDYAEADGVHPTMGVTAAVAAFKEAGFKFIGPTAMLSFVQAAGFVNHHKPDCDAFAPAEASYASCAAAAAERAGAIALAPLPAKRAKKSTAS